MKKECAIGLVRQIVLTDPAYECSLWRSGTESDEFAYTIMPAPPLATVSWARSKVMSHFLKDTQADVLIMMDSDMSAEMHEFDKLAKEALDRDAVVGSLLCKRVAGRGWCNWFADGEPRQAYSDTVEELGPKDYMGAAFTAYPRSVMLRIASQIPYLEKKKMWAFFVDKIVELVDEDTGKSYYDLLTEDRVFCDVVRACGEKLFCDMSLAVQHWGFFGFRPHHAAPGMFIPRPEESRSEYE